MLLERNPLMTDMDSKPTLWEFSYSSIVGMLLYFAVILTLSSLYAIYCTAHYIFCPDHSCALALKRIGHCLKVTQDRELSLISLEELKIDHNLDMYVYVMYKYKNMTDSACVKSKNG